MIDVLDANNSREIILTELIFACSRALSQRGMTGMFLDGVSRGEAEIIPLGESSRCRQLRILSGLILVVLTALS